MSKRVKARSFWALENIHDGSWLPRAYLYGPALFERRRDAVQDIGRRCNETDWRVVRVTVTPTSKGK